MDKKRFSQIIVSLIIVVIVAGLVWYFDFAKKIPVPKNNNKVSTPQNQISSQDQYAGWKTFNNETDGYIIKYPSQLSLEKSVDKNEVVSSSRVYWSAFFGYPNKLGSVGSIFLSPNSNFAEVKRAIEDNNYKELSTDSKVINGYGVTIITMQAVKNSEDVSKVAYITYINNNGVPTGGGFAILLMSNQFADDFDKILSTFYFVTNEESPAPGLMNQ